MKADLPQPSLATPRLTLRPFTTADAPRLVTLLHNPAVSAMTSRIPYPYTLADASLFLAGLQDKYEAMMELVYGVCLRDSGDLIGACGLVLDLPNDKAELGYWLGEPWWGNGYCTEAASALLGHGFAAYKLVRIEATQYAHNPASGRVLAKLGMREEGLRRRYLKRDGVSHDCRIWGLLPEEFAPQSQS